MCFESKQIEKLFPELREYRTADYMKLGTSKLTLMIAMTARTGSSHLCSSLASVLPVGTPTELFNARDTLVWEKSKRNVDTFFEFMQQYIEESDKYVVFKTNWIDFAYFKDVIFYLFPNLRIIYLDRLDIEAQAISLFKAIISNTWHDSPRIKKGDAIHVEELKKKFDLVRICRIISELQQEKRHWETFFFENKIQPARVFYEHFVEDLGCAISQIARHSGFGDVDVDNIHSEFKKMSDEVNEEWLCKVKNYRNSGFYQRFRDTMTIQ